jgi:hypothetical protein
MSAGAPRLPPPPEFLSWADWLNAHSTKKDRLAWCAEKAKTANRNYFQQPKITKYDVWSVLLAAKGVCTYCKSLAVERAPVNPDTGKLGPWAHVGQRIGTLDHNQERHVLVWCCMWCNTVRAGRADPATLAMDHGGYWPKGELLAGPAARRARVQLAALKKEAALKRKQRREQQAEEQEWSDANEDQTLYEWPYLHSDELIAEFPYIGSLDR